MRALKYVFGTEEQVQRVTRSVLNRLLEGLAAAITAAVVLTAEGSLSLAWTAGVFALITIIPALLRVAAEAIPQGD